jgi:alpha-beta hydrolase superfamily lysophospholipase
VHDSADGRRVQSWLIRPPGYDPAKKYPLVLEIHGGPFANYGPAFRSRAAALRRGGYNVLFSNRAAARATARSSATSSTTPYPGRDYDDLMAAVDAAVRARRRRRRPMFVTGGSGGGVLTAWIVGTTDRFRAAAVQKPVINWASFVLTADQAEFLLQVLVQRAALGRLPGVLAALAALARRQREDADHGGHGRAGFPHADRRVRAVLPGAAHPRRRYAAGARARRLAFPRRRPSQLNARIAYILAWFAKHDAAPAPVARLR